VGRLRDLPIWSKLGLIMIVPIIATIVVGTNGLVNNIGQANDADRARTLSGLSAQASALVHELQSERANAALLLGVLVDQTANVEARATFERQIQKTEDASKDYRLTRSGLADPPEDFRKQLAGIDTQLLDLPGMRKQISDGGKDILASTVVSRYRTLIDDLLSIRDAAAELSNNPTLGADMRAAAAISEMKEQVSLERVVVLRVLTTKAFTPQLRKELTPRSTGRSRPRSSSGWSPSRGTGTSSTRRSPAPTCVRRPSSRASSPRSPPRRCPATSSPRRTGTTPW